MNKKGLGKGLSALIKENTSLNINDDKDNVKEIDINKIFPNKNQPRKNFNKETLEQMAKSIKNIGIISPIIVKQDGDFFEIISGERRWRAARLANFKTVPIIVKKYSDIERVEVSLIENIQRENLNPIEEALTYKKLQNEFFLSQEEIAEKVGKNRATIANFIRLLKLDYRVQDFLKDLKISMGHAKALISIENNSEQFELAKKIVDENLNVRQTEELVKNILNQTNNNLNEKNKHKPVAEKLMYEKIIKELNQILGTKVNIKDGKNKGKIEIEYYSEDELERILYLFKKI